jgi:PAS domain S-box-containing protein
LEAFILRGYDLFPEEEKRVSELEELLILNQEEIPGPGILIDNIKIKDEGDYWECFFDNLPEGVVMVDEAGAICRVNAKFCEIFGYAPEEVIGSDLDNLITRSPGLKEEARSISKKALSGSGTLLETVRRRKDGTIFPVSILAMPLAKGIEGASAYAIYRDLSSFKEAQKTLELRLSFEALITNVSSILMTSEDLDFSISRSLQEICSFFNSDCASLFVFDRNVTTMKCIHQHFTGESDYHLSAMKEYDLSMLPWFREKLLSEKQLLVEDTSRIPDEGFRERDMYISHGITSLMNIPFYIGSNPGGFVSVINFGRVSFWKQRDVDDLRLFCSLLGAVLFRMEIEENLRKSEQFNSSLINNSPNAILVLSPDTTITYVSPSFEKMTGYSASEVVGTKAPFPWWSSDRSAMHLLESMKGQPIREELRFRKKSGELLWIMLTSTPVYNDSQLQFYQSIWVDITRRKEAERELENRNFQLQRNVEDMINILGKIIEVGDPYTGGHQQRVSQLSVAIATEMGLPEEEIIPIRYAALVHDVGKIKIPSSILIKPGKITETEMEMIKTHPFYGREILKTVKFPWPISEMIYQHHERLDGSGYPQGLKAPDIMQEARILAVADVVEAMLSHRPYRSSKGLKKTVDELMDNRGILYDPDVVDACLSLLRERRFNFNEILDFLP